MSTRQQLTIAVLGLAFKLAGSIAVILFTFCSVRNAPPAPPAVVVVEGDGRAVVSWFWPSRAENGIVEVDVRCLAAVEPCIDGRIERVEPGSEGAWHHSFDKLQNDQGYAFQVCGIRNGECGAWSEPVVVVPRRLDPLREVIDIFRWSATVEYMIHAADATERAEMWKAIRDGLREAREKNTSEHGAFDSRLNGVEAGIEEIRKVVDELSDGAAGSDLDAATWMYLGAVFFCEDCRKLNEGAKRRLDVVAGYCRRMSPRMMFLEVGAIGQGVKSDLLEPWADGVMAYLRSNGCHTNFEIGELHTGFQAVGDYETNMGKVVISATRR